MKSISKTPGKIFQRDQSKLRKRIKLNYLNVVTTGRRSGGWRVVRNLAPGFYNANCAKNCTVKVFTRVHQEVEPYQKTFWPTSVSDLYTLPFKNMWTQFGTEKLFCPCQTFVWTWVNGISGWTFLKSSSPGQYCSRKVQGWTENIKLLAEIVNPLPPTLPSKRATNRNLHILREQLTLLKTMWKQLIKRSTIFYAQFSSVSIVILQQI